MEQEKETIFNIISSSKKRAIKDIEIYFERSRVTKLSIEDSKIQNVRTLEDKGIGIRVYNKGGMGFSYTMATDKDSIKLSAERAIELAKSSNPDKFFKSLPQPQKLPVVNGIFDEKISNLSIREIMNLAEDIICEAKKVNGDVVLSGQIDVVFDKHIGIVNSRGIDCDCKINAISAQVSGKIEKSKEDVGSGFAISLSHSIDDINIIISVGREAAEKAVRGLGARKTKTRRCPVLFSPLATYYLTTSLLGKCLAGITNSYSMSCLSNKIGKKIASEKLTIWDDGTLTGGIASSPFDGEGNPHKPFPVIEKGILKNYLHTSYSANKMNEQNTMSATRSSYKNPPNDTSFTNIKIVGTPEKTLKNILKNVDDGIFIDFLYGIDVLTGTISSAINYGTEIKNGELKNAVSGAMIGTNLLDVLKNIMEISKDTMNFGGSICPYLLVNDISISG